MGGLRRYLPKTFALMLVGSIAIAGIGIPDIFGFAGFYSKDSILESLWASDSRPGTFRLLDGDCIAALVHCVLFLASVCIHDVLGLSA